MKEGSQVAAHQGMETLLLVTGQAHTGTLLQAGNQVTILISGTQSRLFDADSELDPFMKQFGSG